MEAQVLRLPSSEQMSFDLPFRSSDASVYPIPTSDGATVIIVGHSNGLSIFKAYGGQAREHGFDDIEHGTNRHGWKVSKWLDIHLASPVQYIAFPPLRSAALLPDFLRGNAVVAVACADSSIHLVSFSIEPSLDDTNSERDGSQVRTTKLTSALSHRDLISSLAVTWTASDASTDGHASRPRSAGRTDTTLETQTRYSFLVASVSTTGSGLLVVHRLPFSRHVDTQGHSPVIVARQFMRMPLLESTLCFNPASYPSTEHTSLLITSPVSGTIKVLDLAQSSSAFMNRRGSDADPDNEGPSALPSANTRLTLYTSYNTSDPIARRKQVLDASWATNGKAIVALLEDGEWGVWRIEGAGLRTNNDESQPLRRSRDNVAQGRFAVYGNVSSAVLRTKATKTKSSGPLAPVTPHTRKTRSAALFRSTEPHTHAKATSKSSGRISVCVRQGALTGPDDALLITFNGANSFLPSLQSLQQSDRPDNVMNTGLIAGRVQALPLVRLGGEQQLATSPLHSSAPPSNEFLGTFSTVQNLIVVTNSRLILHVDTGPKSVIKPSTLNLPLRGAIDNNSTFTSRSTNNDMLDLVAMDRMLSGMDNLEDQRNSTHDTRSSLQIQQTSRALDLDTASPTMTKSAKSRLIIKRDAQSGRQPLFK